MATPITTVAGKGAPLNSTEFDNNFINLRDTADAAKARTDVLTDLYLFDTVKSQAGPGSAFDADMLDGKHDGEVAADTLDGKHDGEVAADTVDGFHASQAAGAGAVVATDADGDIALSVSGKALQAVGNYTILSSPSGTGKKVMLATNCYQVGGSTWNRKNTAYGAAVLVVSEDGTINIYAASAGTNPIAAWDVINGAVVWHNLNDTTINKDETITLSTLPQSIPIGINMSFASSGGPGLNGWGTIVAVREQDTRTFELFTDASSPYRVFIRMQEYSSNTWSGWMPLFSSQYSNGRTVTDADDSACKSEGFTIYYHSGPYTNRPSEAISDGQIVTFTYSTSWASQLWIPLDAASNGKIWMRHYSGSGWTSWLQIGGVKDWTDVAYASGNFTASGSMTWTVDAGDQTTYRYKMLDKNTMQLQAYLVNTTTGGTADYDLRIAVPNSKTIVGNTIHVCLASDNGTNGFSRVLANNGAGYIVVRYGPTDVTWTLSSLTHIWVDVTLRVS